MSISLIDIWQWRVVLICMLFRLSALNFIRKTWNSRTLQELRTAIRTISITNKISFAKISLIMLGLKLYLIDLFCPCWLYLRIYFILWCRPRLVRFVWYVFRRRQLMNCWCWILPFNFIPDHPISLIQPTIFEHILNLYIIHWLMVGHPWFTI